MALHGTAPHTAPRAASCAAPRAPTTARAGSTRGSVRLRVPIFLTCQAGTVMCSAQHSRVGRMVLAGSQEDAAPAAGF